MTAALLAVRIKITNFYGRAAAFLPLDLHIGVVHIGPLPQRQHQRWQERSEYHPSERCRYAISANY